MQKVLKLFIVIMLVAVVSGCTTRLVDFTILSTKNVDLTRAATFERGNSRVEGKDTAYIIIFIPTGVPNVKEAIDRAIESVPGAVALVDGVVSSNFFYFPYVYGQETYVVEGTPLIDPRLAAAPLESNYMLVKLDKQGDIHETRSLSQKEYMNVRHKLLAKTK